MQESERAKTKFAENAIKTEEGMQTFMDQSIYMHKYFLRIE